MPARPRLSPRIAAMALALAMAVATPASAEPAVSRGSAAEHYALKLLNCTRTGGLVAANGSCKGRGSGEYSPYRRPLRLHRGISNRVAWPWARTLATYRVCAHSLPGKPDLGQRLRRAGFGYKRYGENLGCGYGGPMAVVLATHRLIQAEGGKGGGHWQNLKSAAYRSVGIGVAVRGRAVMIVYDFYGKRY